MADTLLVGTRKGLATVERTTDGWRLARMSFLGDPVSAVLSDPRDGTWYAALGTGHFGVKLHRSEDGGASWTEVATPEYPPKPDDVVDVEPMGQRPVPWSTELAWVLEAGHADEPEVLWCGTIPGGLFRSSDRGTSWSIIRPLWDEPSRSQWFGGGYDFPGIHSVAVDPRGPGRLTVGISCGGAWSTTDGGDTWQVGHGMRAMYMPPSEAYDPIVQDPHRIVRSAADPDVLWCQHHSGIFRSVDGGATWMEITSVEPSTFGFAVAAHPRNAAVAWFVPAVSDEVRVAVDGRMVVTRTDDGGATFRQIGSGLPDHDAYDLVYRHGLDVDDTGDVLALGSTTGSLWISDDGGESVTTVADHLPPIACVRFA